MWSIIAAWVVLLPHPVTPQTMIMPSCDSRANFHKWGQVQFLEVGISPFTRRMAACISPEAFMTLMRKRSPVAKW
jgi:hypothetical protein